MNNTYHEISQFLFFEARLLDEKRYLEWLELFTHDVSYWMPVVIDSSTATENGQQNVTRKYADKGGLAFYDENIHSLRIRVNRINTGKAWSENSILSTQRFVANIEVEENQRLNEWDVYSNILIFKHTQNSEKETLVGRRKDRICKIEKQLKISKREVFVTEGYLNPNIFI